MKNIFEKNFQNFQQLPLPFNAIFPTLSKINEIHEDYKISASSKYRRMAFESLNDSKSRGGGGDLFRNYDGSIHTCHIAGIRGNDGSSCTCKRNTRALLRNGFGTSSRIGFSTCQLFQTKQNRREPENFPSFFVQRREEIFFSPSFSWIHLNEPRMQLKRYTWTVGKILIFLLIFRWLS